MAEKKVKKVNPSDAGLPDSAVEVKVKDQKGNEKVVKQSPVNELAFLKDEEIVVKGLPVEVEEITGLKILLRRKDIK